MGSRKLVELRQPEGGAEHQIIWSIHHHCPPANALVRELNDNDADLLVYPVGNVGYNMPVNTVFAVDPLGPCAACGREPRCQFVFRKGHVSHAGSIWTPDS